MDIVQIIGRKRVDFTDKETGKAVRGWKLYFGVEAYNVEGRLPVEAYLPDRLGVTAPEVGQYYEVTYNRYGKPASFELVD